MNNKLKDILVRYSVGTLGLTLVAIAVALAIKSDLGTDPISTPPCAVYLVNRSLSIGTYTAIMHFMFIVLQIVLLKKNFKLEYLMQIPAAIVFGALTDGAIWALSWLEASTYAMKMVISIIAVIAAAFGVSMEIMGKAWMLAGEQTVVAIAQVTKWKFSNVKVSFDVFLVAISAILLIFVFKTPFGDGTSVVIREGTIILALFTGWGLKVTDPICHRIFSKLLNKYKD